MGFAKEAKEHGGGKVGVFWDYCSLPQRSREAHATGQDDRTPVELATFKQALKGINAWYGHPQTFVLLVDSPLPEGQCTNTQPYFGRGVSNGVSGERPRQACLRSH